MDNDKEKIAKVINLNLKWLKYCIKWKQNENNFFKFSRLLKTILRKCIKNKIICKINIKKKIIQNECVNKCSEIST